MRTFKVETVTGRLPEIKADEYDTYNSGELIFTNHNYSVKVATFARVLGQVLSRRRRSNEQILSSCAVRKT